MIEIAVPVPLTKIFWPTERDCNLCRSKCGSLIDSGVSIDVSRGVRFNDEDLACLAGRMCHLDVQRGFQLSRRISCRQWAGLPCLIDDLEASVGLCAERQSVFRIISSKIFLKSRCVPNR